MEQIKKTETRMLMDKRQKERIVYEKTRMHLLSLKKKILMLCTGSQLYEAKHKVTPNLF